MNTRDMPDEIRAQIEKDAQVFGNGFAEYDPETETWKRLDPRYIVVATVDSVLSKMGPSYNDIASVAEKHGAISDTQREIEPPICEECGAPVDDMGMCSEELHHETGWKVCETCGGDGTDTMMGAEEDESDIGPCAFCGGLGIVKE